MLSTAAIAVSLLGVGCRSAPHVNMPAAVPPPPVVNAVTPPTPVEPLTDDLDAAIEDLEAIE